jgi:hypothetical protein
VRAEGPSCPLGMPGSRGLPNRRSSCAAAPLTLNTVVECLLRSRSIATYDSPELAELNHSLTTAFNPERSRSTAVGELLHVSPLCAKLHTDRHQADPRN